MLYFGRHRKRCVPSLFVLGHLCPVLCSHILLNDVCRHPCHDAIIGYILHDHGIGPYNDIITYPYRSENPCSCTNLHIVTNDGHFVPSSLPANGDILPDETMTANDTSGMYHDTDAAVCKRYAFL